MVEITKFRIKRRERKFILERLWKFENISSSFPIICQIVIIREMGVFFRCQRVNDLCRWTFKISGIFKLSFHFQKKKLLSVKHSVSQIVRKGMLAKQICVVGGNIYLEGSQINCFARLSCFSFCYDLQKIESNFKLKLIALGGSFVISQSITRFRGVSGQKIRQ